VSLLTVFGLQGFLLWIISMPIQIGPFSPSEAPLGWLDSLGVGIWAVGVFFESVGDWQLARFKSEPANRGKVMDRGLWAYTRHPNYFGDFCVWWGLYLVAAAGGAWWTVFGPLLMSFFLLKVSGVAMLERTITDRRPDYVDYIKRTNAFFPGPKRTS
jgi:steroid 5-alpha reductase family enzyme